MPSPDRSRAGGVLPPDRAFVLQLRAEAVGEERARLAGRVEHVASGRTARFESLPELVAFIEGTLAARRLKS